MKRRNVLGVPLVAASLLSMSYSYSAIASNAFPTKPVKVVVGFAPGGGADALTRIIAEGLSKEIGQQVVVENKPGADGVLSAQAVESAKPDGYTILMGTNTAMVAAPTLRPNPPYNPFKSFTPISSAGQFSMFLVVPSSLPVNNLSELLKLVEDNPGKFNSASSNSASELAMLQLLAGRKVVNARYKGDLQAMTDLLGGQIQMMFTTGTLAPGFVKEGKIKALATLLPNRSELMPDVPTGGELGLGRLTITPWAGFFGPPGMPDDIKNILSEKLQKTLQRPDVRAQLIQQGFNGYGMEPKKFAEFFKVQYEDFGDTVRKHNLKFE